MVNRVAHSDFRMHDWFSVTVISSVSEPVLKTCFKSLATPCLQNRGVFMAVAQLHNGSYGKEERHGLACSASLWSHVKGTVSF